MAKQKIQLSDHFNYSRLLRFVLPCIGTMLFTSIYGVVDGLCVSNFVGKTAFAAVNLIMPPVSYTHLRAHETDSYLVCRLLLEKKKNTTPSPRDGLLPRMPSSA